MPWTLSFLFPGPLSPVRAGFSHNQDRLELRRLRGSHDGPQPHWGPISPLCPGLHTGFSQPCSLSTVPHQPLFSI